MLSLAYGILVISFSYAHVTPEDVGPIHEKHIVTPYSVVYNTLDGLTVQQLFRKECSTYPQNDYLGIRDYLNYSGRRV